MAMSIVEVQDGEDLLAARQLLAEYFASQAGFLASRQLDLTAARRREVAALPGEYAPPGGRLLLAREPGGVAAGCVALRRLEPATCELRRLYVRPPYRGAGLGRRLTLAALAGARTMAYDRVRLNSLPSMARARALYGELGFREIPPYRTPLVSGVLYFELELVSSNARLERLE
jgi:GNAT superfamily N-acetyltransferase